MTGTRALTAPHRRCLCGLLYNFKRLQMTVSVGLKRGGVLNVVRYAIEVTCAVDAIPQSIDVDLSGFDIGDSIHFSTVSVPDGVTPTITDRDFTIATIAAPSVMEEETEVAEEGAEGEGGAEEAATEGEDSTEE